MRHLRTSLVALTLAGATVAAGSIIACSGSSSAKTSTASVHSPLARNTSPAAPPADVATLVKDNTDFAFGLYSGVASDETSNVFYSPYSISLALAMTYEGAGGETAQQMATALSWELPLAQLGPAFDQLDLTVEENANREANNALKIAAAIWGDETLTFKEPFLDALATDFGAGVNTTDFINSPDASAANINAWVSTQTDGKIPTLLPPKVITSDTRAVLVNAIYFQGTWDSPFATQATAPAPFTKLDTTAVQANEMHANFITSYAQGDGWSAAALPYGKGATSMVVVLPDAGQFATVEKGLNTTFFQSVYATFADAQVDLSLPKFTIHGATISLKDQLKARGMTDAFANGLADLSPMATPKPSNISDVLHQAFIAVDENGTIATGATAVIAGDAGVVVSGPPPATMNVDRPFFFFIVENATRTVLFAGRELDPTN